VIALARTGSDNNSSRAVMAIDHTNSGIRKYTEGSTCHLISSTTQHFLGLPETNHETRQLHSLLCQSTLEPKVLQTLNSGATETTATKL
jgi:hypothetical protein